MRHLTRGIRHRLWRGAGGLYRAHVTVAWFWLWVSMLVSAVWVLMGEPEADTDTPIRDLYVIADDVSDLIRIHYSGRAWSCTPSQPTTPGDDGSIAPTGRRSAIQPSEPNTDED